LSTVRKSEWPSRYTTPYRPRRFNANAGPSRLLHSPPSNTTNLPSSTNRPTRSANFTVYDAIPTALNTPSPGFHPARSYRGGVTHPPSEAPIRPNNP
jgi:hypothetical protein